MATARGRRSPTTRLTRRGTTSRPACEHPAGTARTVTACSLSPKRAQHGPPPHPLSLTPCPGPSAPVARALLTRRRAVPPAPDRQHGLAALGAAGAHDPALEREDVAGESAVASGQQLAGEAVKGPGHGRTHGPARA